MCWKLCLLPGHFLHLSADNTVILYQDWCPIYLTLTSSKGLPTTETKYSSQNETQVSFHHKKTFQFRGIFECLTSCFFGLYHWQRKVTGNSVKDVTECYIMRDPDSLLLFNFDSLIDSPSWFASACLKRQYFVWFPWKMVSQASHIPWQDTIYKSFWAEFLSVKMNLLSYFPLSCFEDRWYCTIEKSTSWRSN